MSEDEKEHLKNIKLENILNLKKNDKLNIQNSAEVVRKKNSNNVKNPEIDEFNIQSRVILNKKKLSKAQTRRPLQNFIQNFKNLKETIFGIGHIGDTITGEDISRNNPSKLDLDLYKKDSANTINNYVFLENEQANNKAIFELNFNNFQILKSKRMQNFSNL